MREIKLHDAGENYNVEFLNFHCLQIEAHKLVGAFGTCRRDHKLMLGFGHITWREDMT
jgi:hypothetical protein